MPIPMVTQSQLERLLAAGPNQVQAPETTYDSPFLRLMVSADPGQLTQSFTERNCIAGEIVFREGDVGDSMYLIWSGRVAVVKGDLDSPVLLGYRSAGEIFGEMAVIERQPRSATIIALDNLRLLSINRERFQQLLHETPSVSLSILKMLSSQLRGMTEAHSTGELSERRLIRQVSDLVSEKQHLEELQRLRQETSELIIHDLRNPLSAIAVSLKMLTFVLPEEVLQANFELLDLAQASCDRMQRLVDSLLSVSRMESGETQFVMGEVDIGQLIEEVVRSTSILDRKSVVIQTHIAPGLPSAVADREVIERVLFNLMDNALKYTPDHGQITWSAEKRDQTIQVSITDTGPGIPPQDAEYIFERFAQASGEKPRRRGFGLGLAYCKLAVERHDGRIWVEPGENGQGSRFILTLPAMTA